MHSAQIKAELEMRGLTQRALARDLQIKPATVSNVVNGFARSARVEQRIAIAIGRPLNEIWPSWYDRRGKRVNGRRRAVNLRDAIATARAVLS